MKNERRRDRVWKSMLTQFRLSGEVDISDMDVSLETHVDSYMDALELVVEEDHRAPDDIRNDPGGEGYIVTLQPAASMGTKRHVLRTAAGERFKLAKRDSDRKATWVIGPHLEYLFGERPDTPIDVPLKTEREISWMDTEDFEMSSERRRDRLWLQAINLIAQNKTIDSGDLDASLTLVTEDDRYSTALRILEQESYRQPTDVSKRDGKYTIDAEPDVSRSTKLSLLKTLAKSRYDLLTDKGQHAGWEPGPWGRALFDLPIKVEDVSSLQRGRELTKEALSDDSRGPDERLTTVKSLIETAPESDTEEAN